MLSPNNKKLVVIVGPTAVGKTDLAIELAEALNAEIISADSRYFYQGMNIGTAKPDTDQLARVKHYLIDVADIKENWSLAVYQRSVKDAMDEIISKGKVPLLVGGTGQYIRAIIEGWQIPAKAPDPDLRNVLEIMSQRLGAEELHKMLSIIDPTAAKNIDFRNKRRTIRALEVILHTGRKFSDQRKKGSLDFVYKIVGLNRDRSQLYDRIDKRIEEMFKRGFISEVKALLDQGYSIQDPPMSAIGYHEVIQYIEGSMGLQECIERIKKRSREFVRRQANWFKSTDERISWFDVSTNRKNEIIAFIKSPDGWISG
ncbi:MAG: tRNA (adenosine(37)-N6)-dimethylallyltransferase MiaA [Pelolinea sp.]|nr:tRNA (adenosine(37)-N6)-dimethylallyltransferase MiaA [Pelolinea sp.]